jgi:hypothetical protein
MAKVRDIHQAHRTVRGNATVTDHSEPYSPRRIGAREFLLRGASACSEASAARHARQPSHETRRRSGIGALHIAPDTGSPPL